MAFEVEQKFRASQLDPLREQLAALGAIPTGVLDQADTYFAHPGRNFAETDEALRLRRVGDSNYMTYKGPKLDATTKTRREIELVIESGDPGRARGEELLALLGFKTVAEVTKNRQTFQIERGGRIVEIALDEVAGVGAFVELEIGIDREKELDAARQTITRLAQELGLADSERRSYLEMLLER